MCVCVGGAVDAVCVCVCMYVIRGEWEGGGGGGESLENRMSFFYGSFFID